MSSIAASSPINDMLATLLAEPPALPPGQAAAPSSPASSGASAGIGGTDRGPATLVNLSDGVKAVLAKANADQTVADRLQVFVESRRAGGSGASAATGDATSSTATDSGTSKVDKAFEQLTAAGQQPVTIGPAADPALTPAPVEPGKNFSNHSLIDGFEVSVEANASTGAFSTIINGPAGLFFDKRLGRGNEAGGFESAAPGWGASSIQASNNVEYVTLAQTVASGSSISASASDGTSASASTASTVTAHSASITFAIDFNSGAISVSQTTADVASASQSSQSARSVSITA